MAGSSDPQRRPVLYDLRNQRFLVDIAIGSTYVPVSLQYLSASDLGVTVQGVGDSAHVSYGEDLRFEDASTSAWVGFRAPATVASSVVWQLPDRDGAPAQVWSTDGSGALDWLTVRWPSLSRGKAFFIAALT